MIKEQKKFFRKCDHPDCELEGEYRAPKNRNLTEYYWFCLKHVSEYNKAWNFYDGMSQEEIERENKLDETWHSPSWKFGINLENLALTTKEWEALGILELQFPLTEVQLKTKYKQLVKKYHPDLNGGSKQAEEMFKKVAESYRVLLKKIQKS